MAFKSPQMASNSELSPAARGAPFFHKCTLSEGTGQLYTQTSLSTGEPTPGEKICF